jgi:hypothetical protein
MSVGGRQFGTIVGFALVSLLVASSCFAGTIGQKRCAILDKELSVITHSAKSPTPKAVGELAEKAETLCSKGKTAQGLRAYAKALKLVGSQPIFPSEQQINNPKSNPKSNIRKKS